MSTEKPSVGGEATSICTKCKKPTVHVITALVKERIAKVQCRDCGGIHRYRDPNAPIKPPRKRSGKISPQEAWEKVMNTVSNDKKIPYTLSGHFKVNDVIDHSTFGLGVVTNLISEEKIQVIFKEGEKLLVAGR